MAVPADQSAIVVLVPAAEPAVATLRERHDPSARDGMAAHITVLYPFKAPDMITDTDLTVLTEHIGRHRTFAINLVDVSAFDDHAVYLAPRPAEPAIALTQTVVAAFPEYPPYEGAFSDIVPHLTIAVTNQGTFADIRAECTAEVSGHLPIEAEIEEVALVVRRTGRWRVDGLFPLAG